MSITQYKLTNVMGTMYSEGNLVFTPDSNYLIAPVGNKITVYDLKNEKSKTLNYDSTHSYTLLAISSCGNVLVALNEIGLAHFINVTTHSLMRSVKFGNLGCLKFSPNGHYIAVGLDKKVLIYRVPSDACVASDKPDLVRVFKDIPGLVSSIDWSWDSKLLVVGSKDSPMISVFSMHKFSNFRNSCFTSHREGILGVFFEDWDYNIFSICRNGTMCKWECSTEPEEWELIKEFNASVKLDQSTVTEESVEKEDADAIETKRSKRDQGGKPKELTKFILGNKVYVVDNSQDKGNRHKKGKDRATVTCAELSEKREFGMIGFDDGVFIIFGLPAGELIQELRVTDHEVTTVRFDPSGAWIAIGAGKVGQLLVYDWQAENYILKEQGHLDSIECLDFSSDGLWIVTGGHDGKVKLWKTKNSFSFHTFSGHTSIVTGVTFMQNNRAVISSSLDGTVRAFDVKRDRNFRTFTSPKPTQFCGVTIDSSSTYVASGSVDSFNVYIWHLQSGRFLLEVTGHAAPISAICFSPKQGSSMFATVSWDKTLRIRDCIETESNTQVIQLEAEGTALAFRPDGKEIAVAALNGSLTFIDPEEQKNLGSINCTHHMAARRLDSDGLRVNKNLEDLSFNSVAYSADGTWLLAGGKSVNLCMYNTEHQVIAHKVMITKNRSLDGQSLGWTQKGGNDFGLIDLLEERGKGPEELPLPGTKANSTSRTMKPIVKVYATKFSPTGQMWAAATTEGVMLYTIDSSSTFNPIGANIEVSPQAIVEELELKNYESALYMALRLNIPQTTTMVLERIPFDNYPLIARVMPLAEVKQCLQHLAAILDQSSHIEFHLRIIKSLLEEHIHSLIQDLEFLRPVINAVKKATNAKIKDITETAEQNTHLFEVVDVMKSQNQLGPQDKDESSDDDDVEIKLEALSDSDDDDWKSALENTP